MSEIKLHYLSKGMAGAPALIFLHGLLGSSRNWLKIAEAINGHFSMILVDQRGHGSSPKPKSGYAPKDFAMDLNHLFIELKLSKAIVVGHSMGGRNALQFANLYPEKVSKLVIEDIGPVSTYQNGKGLIDLIHSVPVPFENKREAKQYFLNKFTDLKLGQFLYTHIKEVNPGEVAWDFSMSVIEEIIREGRSRDQWDEIKNLKMPTLVIRGETSQELTPQEFNQMIKANSKIKGVEIKGAGHWVHFDKPKEFTNALIDFIG